MVPDLFVGPSLGSAAPSARARRAWRPAARVALSALFVVAMGACGTAGGCGSCAAVEPLPGGKLPASQTIEGGAQLRVTPHGFSTLTSILPGLLGDQLSTGFCLPGDSVLLGAFSYCQTNQGGCTNGCRVVPTITSLNVTPSGTSTLNIALKAAANVTMPVKIFGIGCTLTAKVNQISGDVPVNLGTNATSGELTINAGAINNFQLSDPVLDGCSIGSDVASFLLNLFHGTFSDAVEGLLSPAIQALIPTFLPSPLGLVGRMDVSQLLDGLAPVSGAHLEARLVPGGYAQVINGGLSLGMITGINADADPTTRAAGKDSEPAACVPPLVAPNLGAPPYSLNPSSRQSFTLPPADAFKGLPDPPGAGTDLAIGISEATLDLLGHHIVTSGALCLGVGTSFVSQLNVGTFSLLVPSLNDVVSGTGNDPLLLVTRPQRALGFTIGDNTTASPAITVHAEHIEADFYAFLYERYVRVFTVDLTLNAGINLEFEQSAGGPTMIKPSLVGISAANVQVTVLNSDFVAEPADQLQAVLPSVFSLVLPLLGDLPEIAVPPFASFELNNLAIQHVKSGSQNFLEIYGSLAASQALRRAATRNPALGTAVTSLAAPPAFAAPSTGRARVAGISAPPPADVRAALAHTGGGLPRVTFDADRMDDSGRELEWTYQINGGMWRPWQAGGLVVEDAAFAWQGKYTIGVKSRVKGDYHTVSATQQFPVIIDSVAPRISADKAAWNGDTFEVPAFDIVSGHELAYAFARPGAAHPESPWMQGDKAQLGREAASAYADADGKLAVFVKDEAGNTATTLVTPGVPQEQSSGGCAVGGAPGTGGLVLVLVVAGLVIGPRRRRRAQASAVVGVLGALVLVLQPACGGDKNGNGGVDAGPPAGGECVMDSDCTLPCPAGQLNFCVDATCACSDDIPVGRVGPYSDLAVAPDGASAWVSAYAESHGDLVVAQAKNGRIADDAWEYVDGVPAGPVVVPGSAIRGGISAAGTDVGLYTSIKVALDGSPIVSYFDRETGSLKMAEKVNGAWQSHVVDAGKGPLTGTTGSVVGMYTSLTLRGDNGRPGIAYLAHVKDAAGVHAEVRFASAQVDHPGAGDWQILVVDSAPLPAADPAAPDVFPLVGGLGLFVDSARMPDQSPVVVYYDRAHGQLKLARSSIQTGKFLPPTVLDGSNGVDAGWTPSVAVDNKGNIDVAYASANTTDSLHFASTAAGSTPTVIDSGLRTDGTTVDGLPKPVFHFVGANAKLILPGGDPAKAYVVYQDATTSELLLGHRNADGTWSHTSVAGATQPFTGGYGFYAAGALGDGQIFMSSWVIDLPAGQGTKETWVEVFSKPTN